MTFTLLPSAWYSLARSIRVTLERKYSMFFFFFFFYKQIAYFKWHCIFWKRQSFQCITCVYIFRQEMVAFMTSLTNYFINTHFLFTPLQKKNNKKQTTTTKPKTQPGLPQCLSDDKTLNISCGNLQHCLWNLLLFSHIPAMHRYIIKLK